MTRARPAVGDSPSGADETRSADDRRARSAAPANDIAGELENVPSSYPIEVWWEGEMRYRGGRPGGPSLVVDGSRKDAPSPVETLLIALAACSAIDVVEILEKRRTPPTALSVRVDFSRAVSPPRRLTAVTLVFRVTTASARVHVERAVELSVEKYCSVAASLAPDTRTSWRVEVEPPAT